MILFWGARGRGMLPGSVPAPLNINELFISSSMGIAVPSLQLGDLQLRTKKEDDIGSEKNVERGILLFSF